MKNKIVITGAAGFLGGRVAKYFAENFKTATIIATSRRNSRALELEKHGCQFVKGDLTDQVFCNSIVLNVEIVVHCAALSAPYGLYNDFYQSNYIASKNLLEACVKNGVKKFIFIGTPSIYVDLSDRFNINEIEPLPKEMINHYAKTKLMAEELILGFNGNGIETISLRPRAIIGAEDTVIFPRVLEAYNKGSLKIIGKGNNICDFTCVRNVIEAILCCIRADSYAYGQAYNITDNQPVDFWATLNYTLRSLNLKPCSKKVPRNIAMFVANLFEFKAKLLVQKSEPTITKYGIGILSNSFTLDISKAKELIHYKPIMSTYEGINEFIRWYKTTK
jgi:nucleoside-diphosphate-sugar epimerase